MGRDLAKEKSDFKKIKVLTICCVSLLVFWMFVCSLIRFGWCWECFFLEVAVFSLSLIRSESFLAPQVHETVCKAARVEVGPEKTSSDPKTFKTHYTQIGYNQNCEFGPLSNCHELHSRPISVVSKTNKSKGATTDSFAHLVTLKALFSPGTARLSVQTAAATGPSAGHGSATQS